MARGIGALPPELEIGSREHARYWGVVGVDWRHGLVLFCDGSNGEERDDGVSGKCGMGSTSSYAD